MPVITDFEDLIVARLSAEVAEAKVEPFPDDPSEYQLLKASSALLVRYNGSRYDDSLTEGIACQNRWMVFQIVAVSRSLRAAKQHQGVYDLVESVLTALTGYELTGADSQMLPTRDEYIRRYQPKGSQKLIWQHGIEFKFMVEHSE
jgi:hypothetical protein